MRAEKRHLKLLLTGTVNSRTVIVEATRFALKQIERVPQFVEKQVRLWVRAIITQGLSETRKIPGYHDEPLRGTRSGQRSIRLNRSWRLIYEEVESENMTEIRILVLEVNKHDY